MTASSGRELYHLQFWLQEASPETFGYTESHVVVVNVLKLVKYYQLFLSS